MMKHRTQTGISIRPLFSFGKQALLLSLMVLGACGGGDSGPPVNSPLATPMALVVNQDDTTLTTLRLDGKGAPVISTLSLGPAQVDAIGGVAFSLGEWIFVTNRETNTVAAIDPISALTPILEAFLTENSLDTRIKMGLRPTRIYRDPVDKEVLWTMNDGDPSSTPPGIDTRRSCQGGSVSVLHNSHLIAGGDKPHIRTTACLSGVGEHFIAFSQPPAVDQEIAFVSSKTTGLISVMLADPSFGPVRWSEFPNLNIDLCDSAKEQTLGFLACDVGRGSIRTPNASAPAGMFWSQAMGKIYSYLSGYRTVVEIDPVGPLGQPVITRMVDLTPPPNSEYQTVGMTPDGRFLFLSGEDVSSDSSKVVGKIGIVDLTADNPSLTTFSIPELDNIRPAKFQFTPDGRRLYLTQSNKVADLPFAAPQAHNLKVDKLLVFDPSTLPAAPAFVAEVDLPSVGPDGMHGMDLWITGPRAAGSAKGVVVTNARSGVNGSVSLIDASSNTITATISVGRNPKQVTVYYYGLAASDNQATPIW